MSRLNLSVALASRSSEITSGSLTGGWCLIQAASFRCWINTPRRYVRAPKNQRYWTAVRSVEFPSGRDEFPRRDASGLMGRGAPLRPLSRSAPFSSESLCPGREICGGRAVEVFGRDAPISSLPVKLKRLKLAGGTIGMTSRNSTRNQSAYCQRGGSAFRKRRQVRKTSRIKTLAETDVFQTHVDAVGTSEWATSRNLRAASCRGSV